MSGEWSIASRTFIVVDGRPNAVAVQAIEALVPTPDGKTEIRLAGGSVVVTDTLVADILRRIKTGAWA